jgi:homoserine O-acetyltransferase
VTGSRHATDSPTVSLGEFTFECGESIPDLEVAYETYGEFTGDNAVLVCHALTGSQHVAGTDRRGSSPDQARAWWSDVVGPGKAIDTNDYFVVCTNVPGGCYGTTGPASTNPETGEPYGTEFPPVTVGDWTRSQRRLLDELGVGRLHAVVGGSVGGMNALDWAARYPDDVRRVVLVAAAARLDPQCLALDAIARRAITTDPDWQGGDYYGVSASDASGGSSGERSESDGDSSPDDGLAQARRIGHVTYLSKDSMDAKFGRRSTGRDAARAPPDPAAGFFPYREVESYLDYQADRFTERFDANSYLYLTRAMDDYDLAAGYDSGVRRSGASSSQPELRCSSGDADALAAFPGEALVLSFTGDWHFTVEQADALADAFRATGTPVAHHVVESDHGHDAFLVEPGSVGPPIRDFLAEGVEGRAVTDAGCERDESPESEYAPVHTSLFSD